MESGAECGSGVDGSGADAADDSSADAGACVAYGEVGMSGGVVDSGVNVMSVVSEVSFSSSESAYENSSSYVAIQ